MQGPGLCQLGLPAMLPGALWLPAQPWVASGVTAMCPSSPHADAPSSQAQCVSWRRGGGRPRGAAMPGPGPQSLTHQPGTSQGAPAKWVQAPLLQQAQGLHVLGGMRMFLEVQESSFPHISPPTPCSFATPWVLRAGSRGIDGGSPGLSAGAAQGCICSEAEFAPALSPWLKADVSQILQLPLWNLPRRRPGMSRLPPGPSWAWTTVKSDHVQLPARWVALGHARARPALCGPAELGTPSLQSS